MTVDPRVPAMAKAMGRAHDEPASTGSRFFATMEDYWLAMAAAGVAAADAVEGDRPADECEHTYSYTSVDGRWFCADCTPDGGVEPSREAGDSTPRDSHGFMLCCGGTDYHEAGCPVPELEARVVELAAALREAVDEVLNGKVGSYGPCVSYTPTILAETVEGWAALAAAGEGEDPRCATCRDVGAAYCDDCSSRVRPDEWQPREDRPFDPCPCGGDHLTIDHPSGSRLPEPTE